MSLILVSSFPSYLVAPPCADLPLAVSYLISFFFFYSIQQVNISVLHLFKIFWYLLYFCFLPAKGEQHLSLWLLHSAIFAVAWLVSRSSSRFFTYLGSRSLTFPATLSRSSHFHSSLTTRTCAPSPFPVGRFGRFLRLRILLMSLFTYDLVMNLTLTIDDAYYRTFPSASANSPNGAFYRMSITWRRYIHQLGDEKMNSLDPAHSTKVSLASIAMGLHRHWVYSF